MPTEIKGSLYFSASELEQELAVSRQTIWRWRKDGRIPPGQRFRGNKVFFSATEAEDVRAYALRLEPIGSDSAQLRLFNGSR
jgi:predicted DNA-binding transcriptional regulator AlpA